MPGFATLNQKCLAPVEIRSKTASFFALPFAEVVTEHRQTAVQQEYMGYFVR